MTIFHVYYFVIEILEKMQLIFNRDRSQPVRKRIQFSARYELYDGYQWKVCMKTGKHFVLMYSPCFIKLGVVQLCIFVSLCKLLHMKTKGSDTDF